MLSANRADLGFVVFNKSTLTPQSYSTAEYTKDIKAEDTALEKREAARIKEKKRKAKLAKKAALAKQKSAKEELKKSGPGQFRRITRGLNKGSDDDDFEEAGDKDAEEEEG